MRQQEKSKMKRIAGLTPAQLKEQKVFAEWDSWGQGFVKADRFIDMLYADLSRK
jgi:hypothetical protein